MKRTLRFYSKQEVAQLKKISNLPKKEKAPAMVEFAKTNQRPLPSAYIKLRSLKSKSAPKRKTRVVKDASLITSPNSKKGEFVIPVKNWKLQHTDGNLNIVINF